VPIPFVTQHIADGVFTPTDAHLTAARAMLNELARWTEAMKPLRAPA